MNIFRRKSGNKISFNNVQIEHGLKNEDLIYKQDGREIYIGFTWMTGLRIYPEGIKKWKDNSIVTELEKEEIFVNALKFIKKRHGKPIVVINTDDPSKDLWEKLCLVNKPIIQKIEYSPDNKYMQEQRNRYLKMLKRGQKFWINNIEIHNEDELDAALENFLKIKGD